MRHCRCCLACLQVPLVAATMGMYDLAQVPQDAQLWQLIALCAGEQALSWYIVLGVRNCGSWFNVARCAGSETASWHGVSAQLASDCLAGCARVPA